MTFLSTTLASLLLVSLPFTSTTLAQTPASVPVVTLRGNQTLDKTISLGKLQTTPKRLLLNYNYDLLSDN